MVVQITVGALLLFFLQFFWNRKLQREINSRIETEQELKRSEASYRNIVNTIAHAREGLFIVNTDYSVKYMNLVMIDWFGDQTGKICYEAVAGRESPCSYCRLHEVSEQNKIVSYRPTTEDGRTFDIVAVPHHNSDGTVSKMEVIRDVTDRENAEQIILEQTQHVSDLLDSTAEAIFGLDLRGNCTFANSTCVQMLGYASTDSLIGYNMHKLIHHSYPGGANYPINDCPIVETFRTGKRVHVDNESFWRVDGSGFPVEYWSHPIQRNNEVVGAVVTFLDISKRLQTEQALQRAQKMESIGLMAGGVAHDLNNILSGITGYPELMLHNLPKDSELRKPIEAIQESGKRAATVVADLLTVARGAASTREPHDINSLIQEYLNPQSMQNSSLSTLMWHI